MAKIYLGLIELSSPHSEEANKTAGRSSNNERSDKVLHEFFTRCGLNGVEIVRDGFRKPLAKYKTDLFFNLSHSGNMFLIGLSFDLDIGVDIERVKPRKNITEIYQTYYAEQEKNELDRLAGESKQAELFYNLWVKKEAGVKLEGRTVFEIGAPELGLRGPQGDLGGSLKTGSEQYYFYVAASGLRNNNGTQIDYEFKVINAKDAVIDFEV